VNWPSEKKLDSLRWFSQHRSQTPHFWGCTPRRAMIQNSNSAETFVQCTYPQVSSSCVYSFGSYRIVKQTDAAENIQRSRNATTLGRNCSGFFLHKTDGIGSHFGREHWVLEVGTVGKQKRKCREVLLLLLHRM